LPKEEAHNQERYQVSDVNVLPVGNGFYLAYSSDPRSARLIPAEAVEALGRSMDLATLEEHSIKLSEAAGRGAEVRVSGGAAPQIPPQRKARGGLLSRLLGGGPAVTEARPQDGRDPKSILNLLRALAEPGLLIGETELMRLCRDSAESHAAPPGISAVGIVTKDRPRMLERCLKSLTASLALDTSSRPRIVIVDGSNDERAIQSNRELAARAAKQAEFDIRYCGLEEKKRFADALSHRAGVDPDLVRFALFGVDRIDNTTGANRNALLLETAGQMFLSLDDDVVCDMLLAERRNANGIELDERGEYHDIRFFASRPSCLGEAERSDAGLLAVHERLLGTDVGSCVLRSGERHRSGPPRFPACFIGDLRAGRGRVGITLNGTAGDSGMLSPFWMSLGGKTLRRISDSELEYSNSLNSREVWRSAAAPTITADPWLMTTAFGCDNRSLMPPFFPVLRNQDGLFGILSKIYQPDLYFGHLPEMILHDPEDERAQGAEDFLHRASGFGMWNMMLAAVVSYSPALEMGDKLGGYAEPGESNAAGSDRLTALGRHLAMVGRLPMREFEELIRTQNWALQSHQVSRLEAEVKSMGNVPGHILDDYLKYVDKLQEGILDRERIVPKDLLKHYSREQVMEAGRELVMRYGRLIEAWPAIVEAARSLRAESVDIAPPSIIPGL